jgi:methyl-accepting chemotaxis protein
MARRDLGVGTKIGFGFAVCVTMLIVVGAISRRNALSLLENTDRVSHTHEVLETVARLTSMVREGEAVARGFVLTSVQELVTEHELANRGVEGALRELTLLTRDNAAQQTRLLELRELTQRKFQFHARLIAVRRADGLERAVEVAREGTGIRFMEEIQGVTDKIASTEQALLKQRSEDAQRSVDETGWLLLAMVLGAMVVVGTTGALIARDIGGAVAQERRIMATVRDAINQLGSATAELLAATAQQGSGAQEQAAAIAETATTAEQIAQTATQALERSQGVAAVSQQAVAVTNDGKRAVEEAMLRISELKERVNAMAQSILTLTQQMQAIGELNSSVGEIAEQSNILALNAAIEASRAGEQGRGFSVVAEEVRALAEQSRKATKQVRQLLGDMQRETNRAVIITEDGTKSAEAAVRGVSGTGEMFRDLARKVSDAADGALQVSASAAQQATGINQIQAAMRDINQVTAQSLSSTRQIESASNDLNLLSTRLRQMIGTGE